MKIEIKLNNPNYCIGCPLVVIWGDNEERQYVEPQGCFYYNIPLKEDSLYGYIRPEQCKKENGL